MPEFRTQAAEKSCDQGRRKNDAFALSATLPTADAGIVVDASFCVYTSIHALRLH